MTSPIRLLTLLILCGAWTQAQAGSLWSKRTDDMKNPFVDDVARNIGDVLTIKISEGSKIDNKAKRDLQKSTDRSSAFDGELGIGTTNKSLLPRIPGFTMDFTDLF